MPFNPRADAALQLVVILAYSLALMAFGVWVSRRVRDSGSFFVADRALGPGLIFSTFLAANIGAGSIIGASGLGYSIGKSAWWFVGSAGLGQLLFAFAIGPRIWKAGKEHGLYTAGDYLEHRYGSAVRAVVAGMLWLLTLTILAAQLIAMSEILEWVLGVPRWVGATLGGLVMTVYFSRGGLLTSAWVNLVQLCVLLVGFAVAVPVAVAGVGGWSAMMAAVPAEPEYANPFAVAGMIYFVAIAPAFVVSPGLIQKGFGAIEPRALTIGVGLQAVVLLFFATVPMTIGMLAHSYATELPNVDFAVPIVLTLGLPALFGALALAAVFSAEMSSADAVLFMLATSLSKDIYKRYLRPDASDADVLRVARYAGIAGGALGVALTIVIPTVLDSITIFYSLLSVILFVPVVAGLYTRRPGVPEALAAIGFGIASLLVLYMADLGGIGLTALGVAASGVAMLVVFAIRRPADPDRSATG